MMRPIFTLLFFLLITACNKDDETLVALELTGAHIGDTSLDPTGITENIAIDRSISLSFSHPIKQSSIASAISLSSDQASVPFSAHLLSDNKTITITPEGTLQSSTTYLLEIGTSLTSTGGGAFMGTTFNFTTQLGTLAVTNASILESDTTTTGRIQQVPVNFQATFSFNHPINESTLPGAFDLSGPTSPALQFELSDNDQTVTVTSSSPLTYLSRYTLKISDRLQGSNGEQFTETNSEFYSAIDDTPKFPVLSEEALLTKVQEQTFRYFWDFAHPTSGLVRERNTAGNTVTIGGSGFGVMALIVGVERGFITRQEALDRWTKIVDFLAAADRFHGAWPHWMNGETGKTIPFSTKDNGGDLVETAFMVQGLLTVRAYLDSSNTAENELIDKITQLWESVEWDWYTKDGSNVLYWHWSPNYGWEQNLPIRGYIESLIVYVLAAASPTHPIAKDVYESGWARNGEIQNGSSYFQQQLPLGDEYGGPLFFAHYSFLGLDPRNLSDQYANYWEQNTAHSLINQAYCQQNPKGFIGYSDEVWGLTASDNPNGYSAHSPTNDLGVITPTAALSSFPYTPDASMDALQFFYYKLGDKLWGEHGFYDAFNITENWYADSYLAIDQGPIILMIENHRTGLLWEVFMKDQEVQSGLDRLGFSY
ncbi:glucoamylase family protein [Echinicola strongylocentroti]|nr:glucoamylase family protein [Echinicola strongylocentroti]